MGLAASDVVQELMRVAESVVVPRHQARREVERGAPYSPHVRLSSRSRTVMANEFGAHIVRRAENFL